MVASLSAYNGSVIVLHAMVASYCLLERGRGRGGGGGGGGEEEGEGEGEGGKVGWGELDSE